MNDLSKVGYSIQPRRVGRVVQGASSSSGKENTAKNEQAAFFTVTIVKERPKGSRVLSGRNPPAEYKRKEKLGGISGLL